MSDAPPARLLDLSRLVSRAGRPAPTGIDRVERAYLRELIRRATPLYGLVRTALGYVLLDRAGAAALADRLDGRAAWGPADLLGRLTRSAAPGRARAEADLRRHARARALPPGLARMLRRHLPPGTAYLNTGHANLSAEVLAAVRTVPGARIAVLVHDTIPLDHPEYSRPGVPERFAGRLRAVGAAADLVVCPSRHSAAAVARHLGALGRVPPILVAPLGIDTATPDPAALPPGLPLDRAFFLSVGTIEPRKNHALLLDLWERFHATLPADEIPRLLIAGARGWRNDAVFRRLDTAPFRGDTVHEHAGLSDRALAALMQRAAGLLFPSHAEGYGLPPLEAAYHGLPVICADLPVCRETLGDYPVYAPTTDGYPWSTAIIGLAERHGVECRDGRARRGSVDIPTWADHFNGVLSRT